MNLDNVTFGYRNLEEGQARFEEHARPRLESLLRQYERIENIRVTVSAQRNWRTVDLTVQLHGALLRAEERSDDPLSAFDKALARMERQLARIKGRQNGFGHESLRTLATTQGVAAQILEPTEASEPAPDSLRIVRTKTPEVKPMTPEEAILQMELLGHDFYVFVDGETDRVGVVYRRKAGGYGLIEPQVPAKGQ